jgi:hypothetical protein
MLTAMRISTAVLVPTLLALTSCETAVQSNAVFANAAQYAGSETSVCGYLSLPGNLLARSNDPNTGLSLTPGPYGKKLKELAEHAYVCVAGPVSYIGCATDAKVVCTDHAFDYRITVRKLLSPS